MGESTGRGLGDFYRRAKDGRWQGRDHHQAYSTKASFLPDCDRVPRSVSSATPKRSSHHGKSFGIKSFGMGVTQHRRIEPTQLTGRRSRIPYEPVMQKRHRA